MLKDLMIQYYIMRYIKRNGDTSLYRLWCALPYSKKEIHKNLASLRYHERIYSRVRTIGNHNEIVYNILLTVG